MLIVSRECKLEKKLSEFEVHRVKKLIMQNRVDNMYIITKADVTEDYIKIEFGLTRYEDKHKEKIEKNQVLAYYLAKYLDYKLEKLKYITGISKKLDKKNEIYESINFESLDLDIIFE